VRNWIRKKLDGPPNRVNDRRQDAPRRAPTGRQTDATGNPNDGSAIPPIDPLAIVARGFNGLCQLKGWVPFPGHLPAVKDLYVRSGVVDPDQFLTRLHALARACRSVDELVTVLELQVTAA
jgi:hypothetical protein